MQKEKFEVVSFYKFCPILSVEEYRISFKKYLIDKTLTNIPVNIFIL